MNGDSTGVDGNGHRRAMVLRRVALVVLAVAAIAVVGLTVYRRFSARAYVSRQVELAEGGNFWSKFRLWKAYANGLPGVQPNPAEARKLLEEIVDGAYVVAFRPVNGFAPRTPKEFLWKFDEHSALHSEKDSIGGASFFRTRVEASTLVASFVTEYPEKMKDDIRANPSIEFVSVDRLTPAMFVSHEASSQASLN